MNASDTSPQSKLILALSLGVVTMLGGSIDALAAPLSLSKVPLYTNESVEPNFVLSTDDSGSMARAYAPDQFNKASAALPPLHPTPINTLCWWRTRNFVFSSTGNPIYFNPETVYDPPRRADGTTMLNASFTAAWEDGVSNGNGAASATRNLATGYRLNWDVGNAPDVPQFITHNANPPVCNPAVVSAVNVTRNLPFANHAFYYRYTGPALPPETGPLGETQAQAATRILARQTLIYTDANYIAVQVPDSEKANFANWYAYYRTRNLLTRTALSRVFDSQQTLRMAWQDIGTPVLTNASPMRTINKATAAGTTHRNNLFSHVLTLGATGGTPNRAALQRVGDYFSNANTSGSAAESNPYYDIGTNQVLSCRQNFHLLVTDGAWKDAAGRTDSATSDTLARTFPDGKAYPGGDSAQNRIYWSEGPLLVGDHDNNAGSANTVSRPGLADNAFYYWANDLRTDLANNVPASYTDLTVGVSGPNTPLGADENPRDRPEIYWNPANDPATWQHVVQYIVAFGVPGSMPNPESLAGFRTNPAVNNPATGAPWSWPSWSLEYAEHPQKIDDTWHAALNSRGEYFSARSPQELIDALNSVFQSIGKRTASNTPVSISSGLLTSSTLGYQTLFDTSDWSGRVLATRLATSTPEWDVACILTGGACPSVPAAGSLPGVAHGSRKIATLNTAANAGVPFRFSSLSGPQQAALNKDPITLLTDSLGGQRVDYIRGDRTREQPAGPFRARKNVLGAVVNSSATSVPRTSGYRDEVSFELGSPERASSYSTFVDSIPLQNTLFFGANDGMLHAVNSSAAGNGGGQERWAYVPGMVAENLNKLTSAAGLQYQSYVDATPQIRDAYINGAWKRVLVGAMRLGAQGVYALDVTNTIAGSEGDVAAKVMWEFTDKSAGAANLGYTYGNPFIARMANGVWVALVPGGHNSEVVDGTEGSGNAALYVVRLDNGTLLRAFDLGAGTRGLTSPNAGDYRANGATHDLDVIDSAFAGDLSGNIWRFNFESTSPAAWTVDKFFTTAANQAITVQPRMVRTAYEDSGTVRRKFVVTFGTGKYIENNDRATTFQQSYYGVYDQGPGAAGYPITQSLLQQQTLTQSGNIRSLTTNQVAANRRGWYFNFLASGERNISTAFVRNVNGSLIFTTLAPLTANPCEPNAISFLMFVDATTGGVPGTGAAGLDTNNDGVADATNTGALSASFDTNLDGVINNSDSPTASGIQLLGYAAGVTAISNVGGGTGSILLPDDALPRPDLNGNGIPDCQEAVPPSCSDNLIIPQTEWRRRSWREITN